MLMGDVLGEGYVCWGIYKLMLTIEDDPFFGGPEEHKVTLTPQKPMPVLLPKSRQRPQPRKTISSRKKIQKPAIRHAPKAAVAVSCEGSWTRGETGQEEGLRVVKQRRMEEEEELGLIPTDEKELKFGLFWEKHCQLYHRPVKAHDFEDLERLLDRPADSRNEPLEGLVPMLESADLLHNQQRLMLLIQTARKPVLASFAQREGEQFNEDQEVEEFSVPEVRLQNRHRTPLVLKRADKDNAKFLQLCFWKVISEKEVSGLHEVERALESNHRLSPLEVDLVLQEQLLKEVGKRNRTEMGRVGQRAKERVRDNMLDSQRNYDELLIVQLRKYLAEGFKDKSEHVLSYFSATPKFETDCKICFGGSFSENNKVIYCDGCNTSFHRICYLLQVLPPESQPFYCDLCKFKEQRTLPPDAKVRCGICCRAGFPLKNIEGQLFHVTCLVLNNWAEVRGGKLLLQRGLDQTKLLDQVTLSEVQHQSCELCQSSEGWRLGCGQAGCRKAYHSICAYLDGCQFEIKLEKGLVRTSVCCGAHLPNRDTTMQVYLRRYISGHRKTCELSFPDFRVQYEHEQFKRGEGREPGTETWDWARVTEFMIKKFRRKERSHAGISTAIA